MWNNTLTCKYVLAGIMITNHIITDMMSVLTYFWAQGSKADANSSSPN